MLDTFYLDGLLDKTCDNPITMLIFKSRKAILPIFCANWFYFQLQLLAKKKFFANLNYGKLSKKIVARITALPRIPLIFNVIFLKMIFIFNYWLEFSLRMFFCSHTFVLFLIIFSFPFFLWNFIGF